MAKRDLSGLMNAPGGEVSNSELYIVRFCIVLVLLPVSFITYFFALPVIQSIVVPYAPGGDSGPWLVRPIEAMRFGSAAFLTAITGPVITSGPLRKLWQPHRELDSSIIPKHSFRYYRYMVKGFLLMLVSAVAMAMYLFSWSYIGPDGIKQRFLWKSAYHTYDEIRALRIVFPALQSEAAKGLKYCVDFKGPDVTFGLENEGMTAQEVQALSMFIATRSGREWIP